jgi:hypothetical protein
MLIIEFLNVDLLVLKKLMIKVEPFFGFSDDSKRSFCSLFWFLDSE